MRVNEWLANPLSGSDWFEIYNPNPQPVELSGLFLTDNLNLPERWPVPPLSFVAGHGFVQFIADGEIASGADHANFSLSKDGEVIAIFAADGRLIDSVRFGPQADGVSQGRLPDGSANIVSFAAPPSPGSE